MSLTAAQLDRAQGALLATAAGDALGAGYEFGPPLADGTPVGMTGGGTFGWAPGEWTDDTSMAVVIAEVAASGADLRAAPAQDAIVARWASWAQTAPDVGNQTSQVLAAVRHGNACPDRGVPDDGIPHGGVADGGALAEGAPEKGRGCAAQALAASAELHRRTGHTAGNGSLMRTAPVALAYLGDGAEDALTEAATRLSVLTHYDAEAGEACVLWCHLIRHAVRTGSLDAEAGLRRLSDATRPVWARRLDEAERARPADFTRNGWVVEALQAAWSAIRTTPVPDDDPAKGTSRADHLRRALESAVRGGRDADTVAAIAGGLLGALHGASAVPAQWRHLLHGWPGLKSQDLLTLATTITAVRDGK